MEAMVVAVGLAVAVGAVLLSAVGLPEVGAPLAVVAGLALAEGLWALRVARARRAERMTAAPQVPGPRTRR